MLAAGCDHSTSSCDRGLADDLWGLSLGSWLRVRAILPMLRVATQASSPPPSPPHTSLPTPTGLLHHQHLPHPRRHPPPGSGPPPPHTHVGGHGCSAEGKVLPPLPAYGAQRTRGTIRSLPSPTGAARVAHAFVPSEAEAHLLHAGAPALPLRGGGGRPPHNMRLKHGRLGIIIHG